MPAETARGSGGELTSEKLAERNISESNKIARDTQSYANSQKYLDNKIMQELQTIDNALDYNNITELYNTMISCAVGHYH